MQPRPQISKPDIRAIRRRTTDTDTDGQQQQLPRFSSRERERTEHFVVWSRGVFCLRFGVRGHSVSPQNSRMMICVHFLLPPPTPFPPFCPHELEKQPCLSVCLCTRFLTSGTEASFLSVEKLVRTRDSPDLITALHAEVQAVTRRTKRGQSQEDDDCCREKSCGPKMGSQSHTRVTDAGTQDVLSLVNCVSLCLTRAPGDQPDCQPFLSPSHLFTSRRRRRDERSPHDSQTGRKGGERLEKKQEEGSDGESDYQEQDFRSLKELELLLLLLSSRRQTCVQRVLCPSSSP